MRLSVRVLGRELLRVEWSADEPELPVRTILEASGGGQFELAQFGFDVEDSRCRTERS